LFHWARDLKNLFQEDQLLVLVLASLFVFFLFKSTVAHISLLRISLLWVTAGVVQYDRRSGTTVLLKTRTQEMAKVVRVKLSSDIDSLAPKVVNHPPRTRFFFEDSPSRQSVLEQQFKVVNALAVIKNGWLQGLDHLVARRVLIRPKLIRSDPDPYTMRKDT